LAFTLLIAADDCFDIGLVEQGSAMTSAPIIAVVHGDGRIEDSAPTAIVPWWSFTKTLIAAAAFKLSEAGKLSLDERVPGHPFTLRQLLQNRAGVGDYGGLKEYHEAVARADTPWSDDEVFRRVPPGKLLFPPGEGWSYSNVGYLILRRVIEKAFGAGLDRVLSELLFAPLAISNARLAQSADEMASVALPPPHPYHPNWAFHGFVIGPAREAALLLHRLLEGSFLSPSSRAALLDKHPLGGALPGRPWETIGYGSGMMMPTVTLGGASLQLAGHSAGGPGSGGAVYHTLREGPRMTVAAFASGDNESAAEHAAVRCLLTTSDKCPDEDLNGNVLKH
jgi:D-alanyl-D-alanine carboxypeptidase